MRTPECGEQLLKLRSVVMSTSPPRRLPPADALDKENVASKGMRAMPHRAAIGRNSTLPQDGRDQSGQRHESAPIKIFVYTNLTKHQIPADAQSA
jgi:hypothetical protein